MVATDISPARRAFAALLLAAGTALGAIAGIAATAGTVAAAPYRDTLSGWADRLDEAATEMEGTPAQPATRIGPGPTLKKGASGERVARLAQRLAELGYLSASQLTDQFNETVDTAVRAYQTAQNMRADGLVGGGTRAALDRTPREAAALMRQTAASMRDFRDKSPDTVLLVNLPSQTTTLVRNGEEALSMRAIVGRPSRETPMLQDQITHIIVNPTWTVPPTVLKQDKLPLLRTKGTPGIEHAVVYLDGEVVEPATVDWSVVTPGRVRIVQMPGNHNALGRFRFNLTNPFNIYLHGTNEPKLFDREIRTVSSGCVRLQDARLMAETLLTDANISPERIDRMLEKPEPQWVKLPRPVPVQFVYWTATVEDGGRIRLHPDIYDLIDETASLPAQRA